MTDAYDYVGGLARKQAGLELYWRYTIDPHQAIPQSVKPVIYQQAEEGEWPRRSLRWFPERLIQPGWAEGKLRFAAPPDPSRPTWVYRYFDADGGLLYIGVAFDVLKRAEGHRRHAEWWPLAATYTEELFPTRTAALAAEAEAIRTEHPLFNVVHNRRAAA